MLFVIYNVGINIESILLNKVRDNNCSDSLNKIIEMHSPLFYDIYKKYYFALSQRGISQNDMEGERDYIIYKAIEKFNPNRKTKFSTWLGNYTRYYCLNLLSCKKRHIYMEDDGLDFYSSADDPATETGERGEVKEFVMHLLGRMKDSRVKKIFHLRYFCDKIKKNTWSQIGKNLNISTQTAINLHDKGKKMLRNKLSSKENEDFI